MALRAARSRRMPVFSALMLAAGLVLSGCASIDDALFGNAAPGEQVEPATTPAPEASGESEEGAPVQAAEAEAPAPETAGEGEAAAPEPEAPPESATAPAGAAAPPAAPASVPTATGTIITPIPVEPGRNTGTTVSQTVAGLRAELQSLQNRMLASAQQLAQLQAASAQTANAYHGITAQITAHLQIGTTRGNPELLAQWNTAQSNLEQLSANANTLNSVAAQIADESSRARSLLSQIRATFEVSGAVDEDHRQLTVLEDETNQTIILTDRLTREVTDTLQRQTAYVGEERGKLAALSTAIANGSFYGGGSRTAASAYARGPALVTLHFDNPGTDYQQALYSALSQALQTRPGANFDVVGVSPTRGTAKAVRAAQSNARRYAQEVVRSMTAMGVPASRLGIASSTDPSVSASEVRVFVR